MKVATPAKPAAPVTCPHLGLVGDAETHHSGPSVAHRCYARGVGRRVVGGTVHQQQFCLAANYGNCSRYRAATQTQPVAAPVVVTVSPPELADLSTPIPERPPSHVPAPPQQRLRRWSGASGRRHLIVDLLLVALVVVLLWLIIGLPAMLMSARPTQGLGGTVVIPDTMRITRPLPTIVPSASAPTALGEATPSASPTAGTSEAPEPAASAAVTSEPSPLVPATNEGATPASPVAGLDPSPTPAPPPGPPVVNPPAYNPPPANPPAYNSPATNPPPNNPPAYNPPPANPPVSNPPPARPPASPSPSSPAPKPPAAPPERGGGGPKSASTPKANQ